MKKVMVFPVLCLVLLCIGCGGAGKRVIPEYVAPHQHFNSRTKPIGDYHAQLAVNHRMGKLVLNIFDIHEKPMKIKAKSVDAMLTLSDGSERELSFKPDRIVVKSRRRKNRKITNSYYIQEDWIKSINEFGITFRIPISSVIYEVKFSYKTSDLKDLSHDHGECGEYCP